MLKNTPCAAVIRKCSTEFESKEACGCDGRAHKAEEMAGCKWGAAADTWGRTYMSAQQEALHVPIQQQLFLCINVTKLTTDEGDSTTDASLYKDAHRVLSFHHYASSKR